MATASGTVSGQHVSAQPSVKQRISLVTKKDFLACYSAVASYITHPEAAHSVEECIIVPPQSDYYSPPMHLALDRTPAEPIAAESDDDSIHRLIKNYVGTLGLGDETTGRMLKALDKQMRELQEPPAETCPSCHCSFCPCPEYSNPDYSFTVATLLISLCPNITTLRVYNINSNTPLGQFLLKNNYGKLELPRPALQKLKEVQLDPVSCENPGVYDSLESLDYLRYFHRLPAINSISMEGLEDVRADDMLFPPKTSSGIKKIHIGHADLNGATIGTIIRIPKALEEFSLSTGGLHSSEAGSTAMLWAKTLGKCLLEHRDSLRELDLDAAVNGPFGSEHEHGRDPQELEMFAGGEAERYEHEMGTWYFIQDKEDSASYASPLWAEDLPNTREYTAMSIGSMHDFGALTRLSIRIGLILGYDDISPYDTPVPSASYRLVDALPPNLEFLRLYGYKKGEYAEIDAHVAELLEVKAERFPRLREIEGVDEFLPGVAGWYGADPFGVDFWERP